MSARILVVDDREANVRLLQAKLSAEYYDVIVAYDGPTALAMAASEKPDIVLLDVMMPGMDGFAVCRRLKDDPETRHIPVVLVTALDGRGDRVTGLEAGADEFLTKPIDDVMLFARVRSLTRLKTVIDELRTREASGRRMGVIANAVARLGGTGGRILVVDDNARQAQRVCAELAIEHRPVVESQAETALLAARGPVDLLIVNIAAKTFDGLRFCAQIRSDEATRGLAILAVVDFDERPKLVKALELGVNDVLARPIDPLELAARARTQIRRKRYTDYLRDNLDHSLELAVTDQLTGLHNRRYMTSQLDALVRRAVIGGGDPVALLVIDIDHFKKINDNFGHQVGDEVLREFAVRLASNVRAIDLPVRFGGEEFVVVMPDTTLADAGRIAERIRLHVAGSPFRVLGGEELLTVTISIGVAASLSEGDSPDALLRRSDEAMYEAKTNGRNQVIARAAAAKMARMYGIARWDVVDNGPEHLSEAVIHGFKTPYRFRTARGGVDTPGGRVDFQLVQPLEGWSTYQEWLITRGEGVVGMAIAEIGQDEYAALAPWLSEQKVEVAQSNVLDGVVERVQLDTRKALGGFYMELLVARDPDWRTKLKIDETWDLSADVPAEGALLPISAFRHFGVVVHDLMKVVPEWNRLFGATEFRFMNWKNGPESLVDPVYNGAPVNHEYFTTTPTIGQLLSFELIQPTFGPSHYKEDVLIPLGEGVHHLFTGLVDGRATWDGIEARMRAEGAPVCMGGGLGDDLANFYYLDTRQVLPGYVTEFLHPGAKPAPPGTQSPFKPAMTVNLGERA